MALFGGSKPDHPMADIREAKKFIADLPAADSVKALDEATFWLDSITNTEGFKLEYRYELVDLLDHAAKVHQRKLSQEYQATDRQEKFRENKLWNSLSEFWKALSIAYGKCIEEFQAGASGTGAVRKLLPTVIARVMRALTLRLKWILLRYGPIDSRVWGELGRQFLFAEVKAMTATPVEIYPGLYGQSSVQQEFLKAMMLGISSTDGLTPIKQEIAERAVAHFGGAYILQRTPTAGCNYYFDLSMHKPAARVLNDDEQNQTTRYFGAGKALPALQQLIQNIKSQSVVPPDVNLGGTYPPELVLSVLEHLAMYWSDNPPARSSERRKIATRMTVVHGFQNIMQTLDSTPDTSSLDFNVPDGTESWIVENVSEGGFGVIIPHVNDDWIKIGSLLCVQTETAKYWGVGVVRRIVRDEYQQRRVGIQVLSKAVIPIRLSPGGTVSSINTTRDGDSALLLSTKPDKNGEIALLLRGDSFTSNQALEMDVRGKQYHLTSGKIAESGEDFDWARFKIMQRT